MTEQNQIPDEKVALTLITAFNYRTASEVLMVARGFFNSLPDLIRERDPEALQPGNVLYSSNGRTEFAVLTGNSKKIVAQLCDIFKDAHAHDSAMLSKPLPGQRINWISPKAKPKCELILTITKSLPNFIKREKLPLKTGFEPKI